MAEMRVAAWIGVGIVAIGCGTALLDAGSNESSDAGEPQGRVWNGVPSYSYDLPCLLPAPSWVAGSWRGTFDAYALPSGSSSIRVDVRGAQTPGGLCGTVVFGEGDPLPLPTDVSAPPPGAQSIGIGTPFSRAPREGFVYEFYAFGPRTGFDGGSLTSEPPAIEGQRIHFSVNALQIYKAWCNMQPSYLWMAGSQDPKNFYQFSDPKYSCVPLDAIRYDDTGSACPGFLGTSVHHVSCQQAAFCAGGACACYGPLGGGGFEGVNDGCTAASDHTTRFDLTVTDATMVGSVVFSDRVESAKLTGTL